MLRGVVDPRLSLAFGVYRSQVWRAVGTRFVMIAALLGVALFVRHWGTWTLFGVVGFMQAGGSIALLVVSRTSRRIRAELEADPRQLVWLHTAPEPRTKLHRVELYTRAGDMTVLFVPAAIAKGALDAAREQPQSPTTTTDAAEHAAAEPRHRLAGKLVKLEKAATSTGAPKLAALGELATAASSEWRARLVGPGAHPFRSEPPVGVGSGPLDARLVEAEARVDKLLHLYLSSELGESHRAKMSAIEREKALPEGMVARELFTDEISVLLAELRALAEQP